MPEDVRAMQARDLHRRAKAAEQAASELRDQRNRLIRGLRDDGWSHRRIAAEVGCSAELVNSIVMRRVGPGTRARRRAD